MRQVGILAAAGLIGLETMTKRLKDDHANARYLAENLSKLPHVAVDLDKVHINMVFFSITKPGFNHAAFTSYLLEKGIKTNPGENGEYRFVTHNDISRNDVDYVLNTMQDRGWVT